MGRVARALKVLVVFVLLPASAMLSRVALGQAPGEPAAKEIAMAAAARMHDAGRLTGALKVYEDVLASDPGHDAAYRMRVLTLSELGNSQLAYEAMKQRPTLFADHEREHIQNNRIARGIVWGSTRPESPDARLLETRQALAALRSLQRNAPRTTRWEATRLRVDALLALNHLQRHDEVVAGYEALVDEGIEVPAYILATVGDSLLALRRPEDAVTVLQAAHAHNPDDATTRILLGYAWLERERFDRAMPVFEQLAASQSAWPQRAGAKSGYENWDRYSADVNLALAHAYANDTARAEREFAALADVGPYNAGLQTAVGTVEARRLRPRAALERHAMALTIDPQLAAARVGQADAWIATSQVDRAGTATTALRQDYPHDPRLDRLETELQRRRGWQLRIGAARARSEPRNSATSASPFGSRDGSYGVALESPLIGDRWRVGVATHDDWADFDEQRVHHRAVGVGVSYRSPPRCLGLRVARE